MLRTVGRSKVFVAMLVSLATVVTRAYADPLRLNTAAAVQEASARNQTWQVSPWQRHVSQPNPCNITRRAMVGGLVGFVSGMIVVNRAAAANGGRVGVKDTLAAGAYGGLLGAAVGVATCW